MELSDLDTRVSKYPRRPLLARNNPFPLLVDSQCFIWTGGKRGRTLSRPAIHWKGQPTSAARIAYHIHADPDFDWADETKKIRHLCGNGLCVNPEHMLLGSKKHQQQDIVMLEIVTFYQSVFHNQERLDEFYAYLENNFEFRRDKLWRSHAG